MSKTEISLDVERTIKTDEFEGLRIRSSVKRVVEWETDQEREEKSAELVEELQKKFIKTYKMITETCGVQRSLGTGTKTKNGKPVGSANVTTDDEVDIFG